MDLLNKIVNKNFYHSNPPVQTVINDNLAKLDYDKTLHLLLKKAYDPNQTLFIEKRDQEVATATYILLKKDERRFLKDLENGFKSQDISFDVIRNVYDSYRTVGRYFESNRDRQSLYNLLTSIRKILAKNT